MEEVELEEAAVARTQASVALSAVGRDTAGVLAISLVTHSQVG